MRAIVTIVVAGLVAGLGGCNDGEKATPGDPVLGRQIAEQNCQRCHAIGPDGDSPLADAPPFREIVKRWPPDNIAEALAEGIEVTHQGVEQMPEFQFDPTQIDNLIAYLNSLQKPE